MSEIDALGYVASLLVLATFCMQGMVALRAVAIAGNVAFIAYGAAGAIDPVLLLHVLLLPVNAWRLREALRTRQVGAGAAPEPAPLAGPGAGEELRREARRGPSLRSG